jgi:hypothetical protein
METVVGSRLLGAVAVVAAAFSIGCAGTRRVGASGGPVARAEPAPPDITAAAPPVDPAPPPTAAVTSLPAAPVGAPASRSPSSSASLSTGPVVSLDEALRSALIDLARSAARRREFARAVVKISTELGVPIPEAQAMREMPCGGWSGPDCSNLTLGLEIARVCAPVIASFHNKRTAEIASVLAEAVSVHAVWHDAYGYVRRVKKKGPGYTYAGCLFSRCDPADLENGQVDGVLYQVGRLLGALTGPACGPECKLGDL